MTENELLVTEMAQLACVKLSKHERGRKVLKDLYSLLNGPAASLDQKGWDAVVGLISLFRAGRPGTVLHSIECVRANVR